MKSKLFISLLFAMLMLLTLAVPVFAGAPTEKVKYSHRSDCVVSEFNAFWSNESSLWVGDTNTNMNYRSLVKFPLGGIKVGNIDWVELEFHVQSCTINGSYIGPYPPTLPNIGLGDTLVVPVEDYGRTPSAVSYNETDIGPPIVLIPAGAGVNATVSANVTDAVIDAKTARSRFVAFRVQTAVDTINEGATDRWFFASSNVDAKSMRPRLIVHLKS